MSIFGTIMDKIFHHDATQQSASATPAASASPSPAPAATTVFVPTAAPPAAVTTSAQPVDVGAVLTEMASLKNGGGNYQTSIVDLLKLLDLDSSLSARKDLAEELDVHVGEAGSAEENIALHKAVMNKLAESGGVVPDSLRQ